MLVFGRVGEARVAGPGGARDGGRVWVSGCPRIQKTKSSSSERPPYSSSGNLTSTPAAMRDLAIQANRLFLEFFASGVALSP